MMRRTIVAVACLATLAACGKSAEEKADANAAAADYRPPTVTSRSDYGGMIERRFHRLDTNRDDKLEPDELPPRLRQQIAQWDRDGDGKLNSEEWGTMMLARFDLLDANRDGSLTSDERAKGRDQGR